MGEEPYLNASVPPVYGAATYNWQVAAADAPAVLLQTNETTAADTSFNGLMPGKLHIVRANAVGCAGTSDWSQSATLMVV